MQNLKGSNHKSPHTRAREEFCEISYLNSANSANPFWRHGNRNVFFESSRPVKTSGFDYASLDGDDRHTTSFEQRYAVSEWFRVRFEWINQARTVQSRRIRWALVQAEINGTSASAIAKQFGVTRQSVHEQLKELRNLTPSFIGKND